MNQHLRNVSNTLLKSVPQINRVVVKAKLGPTWYKLYLIKSLMWVLCFFVKHFLICCCKKSYSQATCMLFHTIHCSYTYMACVQDVNMFVPMIKHSYLIQYILFSQVAVLLKDHYRQCHSVRLKMAERFECQQP